MARGGLTKWFAEKWVDLSRPIYDDDGELLGFEPCGRHKAHEGPQGGAKHYPKCRPLREAMSMTERERKASIKRKRKVERDAERLGLSGPGSRAKMVKNPNNLLLSTIQAYNCGPRLDGGEFSLDYVGTGEGNSILGPGIYFTTDPNIAKRYARRFSEPFIHTVLISTRGFYSNLRGEPIELREALTTECDKIAAARGLKRLPSGISLIHGQGAVGDIVRAVGADKALKIFARIGLRGCFEWVMGGESLELAVFDTRAIKIIDSSPVARKNPRKKHPPRQQDTLTLEASAVQQGLFLPSAYEKKPKPKVQPVVDERQADLFGSFEEDPGKIRENKGEHKFIRRYPVRSHKEGAKRHRKYRYSYDIDESVRTTLPAREGEKIRIPHDGKPGHYEVVARLSNETVGIKHDETDHFLVITDLCLREFARDIYHPAQDSLPGDDIRHAHQREDALPRSRDDALQMIIEASGIQDHDLAQADEAYREWKANKGKKRQKPPPWRGGQLDSFETDLPRKGKGTGKARRHFTSLLEAFESATKGAHTWRDLEPALALLREVPGFEDARFPDEVYERHVRHDADLRDEGFTVDFRQYGVEPKGTEQEDINEVIFIAETKVPPRIEREAAERAAAEEATAHFETFPEDEDPWGF